MKVNSTSIKNVLHDSFYSGQSLSTDFNDCFVSFTIDVQEHPIHRLDGGSNFHETPLFIKEFSILVWFRSFNNMESSPLVPIKFVPLSAQIVFGFPLLVMNLIKSKRKLPLLKSQTKSQCMARVIKQTKTAP